MLGGTKNPMMRFVDGKVCVNSDEYAFSNIKNFYISETDDPSGIEHLLKEQQITYKAGTLIVHTDNPESIGVYNANGMKVSVAVEQLFSIATLPKLSLFTDTSTLYSIPEILSLIITLIIIISIRMVAFKFKWNLPIPKSEEEKEEAKEEQEEKELILK
jgi:hypothetical protein